MKVSAGDVFEPLVLFWKKLLEDPRKLARTISRFYPITREDFYRLQKDLTIIPDPWRAAAVFFVLNRSSFSGVTLSGGFSPGAPRFTRSAIERVRRFTVNRDRLRFW